MQLARVVALCVLFASLALAQASNPGSAGSVPAANAAPAPQAQPPSYANYNIMLLFPPTGHAVVMMYNPQGRLEFVPVNSTKQAFESGYVPVRAADISNLIDSLSAENKKLESENAALRNASSRPPTQPSSVTVVNETGPQQAALQREAMERAERQQRRQQLIQTFLGLQNRSQNVNVNVTNCNQYPALCVGR
jgi:hypothetical protein